MSAADSLANRTPLSQIYTMKTYGKLKENKQTHLVPHHLITLGHPDKAIDWLKRNPSRLNVKDFQNQNITPFGVALALGQIELAASIAKLDDDTGTSPLLDAYLSGQKEIDRKIKIRGQIRG